ncbi:hypothetical protein BURKHO8Y_20125 [Burkholderia sp. 8Y]|nr:hypothetical protein BURKHO8Y_20125 [Burkholderia sp. 8Y]
MGPQRADSSGNLVGQRNGRYVVVASLYQLMYPTLLRPLALGGEDH